MNIRFVILNKQEKNFIIYTIPKQIEGELNDKKVCARPEHYYFCIVDVSRICPCPET